MMDSTTLHTNNELVTPAKAGVQRRLVRKKPLDSRLRGNDKFINVRP